MRIALISNTQSGSGEAGDAAAILSALGAEVSEHDLEDVEAAVAGSPERLVVAGGDGSLGEGAMAASEAGIPFAVLPTGTANDFARALGIPDELEEACRIAVQGDRLRRIDIALFEGFPFLNVAALGLAPAAAQQASGLKRYLGPVAYAAGAFGAGLRHHPVPCEVACDGVEIFVGEAWQVSVGVTGAFGGGSRLDADQPPADGTLDVVVIPGGNRGQLMRYAFAMRMGNVKQLGKVVSADCRRAVVRVPGQTSYNVDGELMFAADAEIELLPGAVEVVYG